MRQVSGFACPECGQSELADIISTGSVVQSIELSCPDCAAVWWTEVFHT